MIKRVVLTTLLFAFAGNVMSAQAQFRPSQNDRFDRGNFRNGFQDYLNNLQAETRRLKDSIDRDLDRSRSLDGTRREDRINQQMGDFKNEVDRLRDRFKDNKPIRDNISSVVRYRPLLDNYMRRSFVSSQSRQYWNDLRPDLDRLERVSQGDNRFNYNNGGVYQGDNRYNNNDNNGSFYQGDGRYNNNYRW
ncbi:MAG: hypothetical protein ABI417_06235 [Coleofasciculaceae cyanobacterium]